MMGLTTRTDIQSASKRAIAVLIKVCFVFTGFLIHLQNFIVNQIWRGLYLGGKVTGR